MPSYQYRKKIPVCGNKTILRPSYLHGISYTGKMASLYLDVALNVSICVCMIYKTHPSFTDLQLYIIKQHRLSFIFSSINHSLTLNMHHSFYCEAISIAKLLCYFNSRVEYRILVADGLVPTWNHKIGTHCGRAGSSLKTWTRFLSMAE